MVKNEGSHLRTFFFLLVFSVHCFTKTLKIGKL